MQAIVTKYFGPTNFRGSRVKATCQAGSLTIEWDDALCVESNHDAAALALAHKLGWDQGYHGGFMTRGALPGSGGNVYTFPGRHNQECLRLKGGSK